MAITNQESLVCGLQYEMWGRVFFYLNPGDLVRIRTTCKLFAQLVAEPQQWKTFLSRKCFFLGSHIERTLTHRSWRLLWGNNTYLKRMGYLEENRQALMSSDAHIGLAPYEKASVSCVLYVAFFLEFFSRKFSDSRTHQNWRKITDHVKGKNAFELKELIDQFICARLARQAGCLNKDLRGVFQRCLTTIVKTRNDRRKTEREKAQLTDKAQYERQCATAILRDAGAWVKANDFNRALTMQQYSTIPWMIEAGRTLDSHSLQLALDAKCPYEVVVNLLSYVNPTLSMLEQAKNPRFYSVPVAFLLRGFRIVETPLDIRIQQGAKNGEIREMCANGFLPDLYTLYLALHCKRTYKVIEVLITNGAIPSRALLNHVTFQNGYSRKVSALLSRLGVGVADRQPLSQVYRGHPDVVFLDG